MENGVKYPCFIKLGTGWRCAVSFKLRQLVLLGNNLLCLFYKKVNGIPSFIPSPANNRKLVVHPMVASLH